MDKTSYTVLLEKINHDLERLAGQWQKQEQAGEGAPAKAFCDVLLRGGKRLRGVLAMQSYYAHGGDDDAVALGAARVFEIIQTSILIVDDIADRSDMRRGGPAAHKQLADAAKAADLKGSDAHYGVVQTMNIAYEAINLATIELLKLPVSADVARHTTRRFHENIAMTIRGQIDDIYNEATPAAVSLSAIERVMERKSAYYTVLSPLELGAQLAGATTLPPSLRDYSLAAGKVFQIADDILGIFGASEATGKGSNDDIREGKQTLLAHYAFEKATAQQEKMLEKAFGNRKASVKQCGAVRTIFEQTGALEKAKKRQAHYEKEALAALDGDKITNPAFIAELRGLVSYFARRTS
jgi:geranylgeranyl diphosphate synthase, type I